MSLVYKISKKAAYSNWIPQRNRILKRLSMNSMIIFKSALFIGYNHSLL